MEFPIYIKQDSKKAVDLNKIKEKILNSCQILAKKLL